MKDLLHSFYFSYRVKVASKSYDMATMQAFSAAQAQIWDFPKLKGQENYQPWAKKMKSALKFNGLWKIVEQGLETFPADLPVQETVAEQQSDGTIRNRITREGPTEAQVNTYQAEMKTWKGLNNQASELIYTKCEEKPAEAIEDEEFATNRWVKLQTDYSDSGFVLRITRLQELWTTTMANSNNSIETYTANIRTRSKNLKRMGAPIDEWILVALLLNNLNSKFKKFVHCLLTTLDDVPNFDKIVTLLHKEERLLKREVEESAKAAALKRFNKEQEDKKKSRGNHNNNSRGNGNNNSGSGRGGRNSGGGRGCSNNNTNNDNGPQPSRNPNNANYKGTGEAPDCTRCAPNLNGSRKKHWPFNCWTLDPEKMPERLRNTNNNSTNNSNNSRPRANVANNNHRPDDFVDDSSTHIAPMAHLHSATCEDDVGDDEFWGFTPTTVAPKTGDIVMAMEQEIDSLQAELAEMEETSSFQEEKPEKEAALLNTSLVLGGAASRGAQESPPKSQHLSAEMAGTHESQETIENEVAQLNTSLNLGGMTSQEAQDLPPSLLDSPLPETSHPEGSAFFSEPSRSLDVSQDSGKVLN